VKKSNHSLSNNILLFTLILCFVGILMCLSTTSTNYFTKDFKVNPYSELFQQVLFTLIGFTLIVIIKKLPQKFLKNISLPVFAISVFLLLLVLVPGFYVRGIINESGEMAKRWISLPFGFNLQPSELAKLAIILFFANYFSLIKKGIKFKHVFFSVLLIIIPALLIYKEPNFSASVLFVIVGLIPVIIAGAKIFHLLIFILPTTIAGYVLLIKNERLSSRFQSVYNVFSDPMNSGYQVMQSFMAIAKGNIFGSGFMKSSQKFYLLPESQSDFVFSVICEEFGLIGAFFIIIVFILLFIMMIRVVLSCKNYFDTILVSGIAAHIFIQAAMHIGVTIGLFPPTGIPLPFLSTGGSAIIINLCEIGLVCNVADRIAKYDKK
jgi:cell division protein FtsW